MSQEPTLPDLMRQADKLRAVSKRKRESSTNQTVQDILNEMEKKGSALTFKRTFDQDTIDTLAKLGIKAHNIQHNCDCYGSETCRWCRGGEKSYVELGPKPYEVPKSGPSVSAWRKYKSENKNKKKE